jgi:hypothetical protein
MTDPHPSADGRPAPALYAPALDQAPRARPRPLDADLASYPRRVGAFVVDAALAFAAGGWALLTVRSGSDADPPSAGLLALAGGLGLALAVVQWVLHGRRGWTVGRLLCGIRTVDVETRRPIGMARVLVRGLVVAAGSLACLVGAFVVLASPLVDRTGRRRGWHDRAARDEVLDARALARPGVAAGRPAGEPAADVEHARAAEVGPAGPPASGDPVPAWASSALAPAPELRPWSTPAQHEMPAVTGSLRLAPLAPQRSGPDLDTRAIPVIRAAAAGPAPAPPRAPVGLDPELELTHRAVPHAAVAPTDDEQLEEQTLPITGPETAEIELSDGRRLYVERTALVGRNPVARTSVRAIRVHDPNRSVSKTHLQIGVEPGGVWVADRGSTNGTVVTLPDGGQVRCGVDQRVRLRVGSVVMFGDCALRLVRGPGSPPAG